MARLCLASDSSLARRYLTNDRCRREGNCSIIARGIFNDTCGAIDCSTFNPWWRQLLQEVTQSHVLPHLGGGKMYRGVFLGDELCGNAACWARLLAPLSAEFRRLLPPDAVIYTNAGHIDNETAIPPAFDLVSFDHYTTGGFSGGADPKTGVCPETKPPHEQPYCPLNEVREVRAMYEALFPRLHPHQQVLLVPGVFGCDVRHDSKVECPWNHGTWNVSQRLESQGWALVQKLKGYWEWALQEPRIAGFNPYHYDNEPCTFAPARCQQLIRAHGDGQLRLAVRQGAPDTRRVADDQVLLELR